MAIGWSLDRLTPRRAVGLVVGLVGAAGIIVARLGFSTEAEAAALMLALIAPFSIALGNVVRSRYWPAGAQPLDIAPGMLLFAAAELGLIMFARPQAATSVSSAASRILATHVVVSAVFYALYFRLQHLAGPVYLSQIGYVGTVFAMPLAVLVFGERVTSVMLASVALVIAGVFLVRPRPARPRSSGHPIPGGVQ